MSFGRSSSSSTVTPQFAPGEQKDIEQQRQFIGETLPGATGTTQAGLNLSSLLLGGGQLPGFLGTLQQGFSPEITQSIVQESIEDIRPGLQASGLLDSGVRAELEAETAANIRRDTALTNLNILQNLLQAGIQGGPAFISPVLSQQNLLASRLAGLRPQTTTQMGGAGSGAGFQSALSGLSAIGSGFGEQGSGEGFLGGSSNTSDAIKAAATAAQIAAMFCWVSSELYGGWDAPRTRKARFYIAFQGPAWFRKIYIKHGEKVASFIKDKPLFKKLIQPIFDFFVRNSKGEI